MSCDRLASLHGRCTAMLVALLAVVAPAGCGSTTPPAPPPPPPPAPTPAIQPAPVNADPRVVVRNLVPFYCVFFGRGFNPHMVEMPYRQRVDWSDQQTPGQHADAWNATPKLSEAAAGLGLTDPAWLGALRGWAVLASEPWWRDPGAVRMPPMVARGVVLAMMFEQAIRDADQKNYHRAHVLLTDVAVTMGEEYPLRDRANRDMFAKFFAEVPDAARFKEFAGKLGEYTAAREKEVLVGGEHAAVLHAAGLTAAADFMREQLRSQFDLITFPMIDSAIEKGVKYGFRAPDDVVDIRRRLAALAEVLSEGAKGGVERCRSEAVANVPDAAYIGRFAEFEAMWRRDGQPGGAAEEAGIESRLGELAAARRSIVEWLREKSLVVRKVPLLTLRDPMTYRFLELISPLMYDAREKGFDVRSLPELVASRDKLDEAIGGWCRGEPLAEDLKDGSAHALLAWFWTESGRPELARAAIIEGSRVLLERVRQMPREQLENLGDAAAGTLVDELNGYRFLVAAAEIEAAPPGAARGAGARYLPELAVLLARWQGTWERCALPELAADTVVREIESQVELSELVARLTRDTRERYSFDDYRFAGGCVPQVVLERAINEAVFGPTGETPPSPDAMWQFFQSFTWPTEFSLGSRERWKQPAKK